MPASHRAIREVIEAFNAGQVQLKIDFNFPTEAVELWLVETEENVGRRVISDGPPEMTITAIAREHNEDPRLILITHRFGKTEGMSF